MSSRYFKFVSSIILALYFIILIWVVIFKCNRLDWLTETYNHLSQLPLSERISRNLIPFNIFSATAEDIKLLEDILLNIIVFIPMGMYVTNLTRNKRILRAVLISLAVSLFVELFQAVTLIGSFDVTDLITNTLGGLIGALLYFLLYREYHLRSLNIISTVIMIIVLPLATYAVINTVANIDGYLDMLFRRI